ncbi:LysM peptidoglycan-binding domain-containing protein [Clostridium estertheticum]|uniref:LysM peptidoglycan-binding domain-containing protein n=1 Tax=Clostridium estertheticum TaxID=238834 RepID=UPI00124C11B6|nr:LysM peptidoglycan-binding domain-containing protein [Clostridium estertheticum]MBZ9615289.1 LysM peptidoglycan-binding domain-containing protein [Clostridium estertheticum subsp. laramiense]WAG75178.1 LysM peptidoglycan-binding domain-containing protein [Clostridium estertheticum]
MEFWLIQNSEKLQLPVPPPKYSIKRALSNTVMNVEGIGEVSFIGKPKLIVIPVIETFFPNQVYSFCQYKDFPNTSECTAMIVKWMASGKPIRYIITGVINLECTIESFEYGEADGTGDVSFSLELKQYKRIVLAATTPTTTSSLKISTTKAPITTKATVAQRPTKDVAKKYTVKAGDTLSAIAKKQYGDSSKYTLIASKNKLKNPNSIKIGQVLIL